MSFHTCWYETTPSRLVELVGAINTLFAERRRWSSMENVQVYEGYSECPVTTNIHEREAIDAVVVQLPPMEIQYSGTVPGLCDIAEGVAFASKSDWSSGTLIQLLREMHDRFGPLPVLFLSQTRGIADQGECDRVWGGTDCEDGYRKEFTAQTYQFSDGSCLAKPVGCPDVYYFPVCSNSSGVVCAVPVPTTSAPATSAQTTSAPTIGTLERAIFAEESASADDDILIAGILAKQMYLTVGIIVTIMIFRLPRRRRRSLTRQSVGYFSTFTGWSAGDVKCKQSNSSRPSSIAMATENKAGNREGSKHVATAVLTVVALLILVDFVLYRSVIHSTTACRATLTAVVTGDMHGHVDGVSKLSAIVTAMRRAAAPRMLFSTGDAFLGSAFFRLRGPTALGRAYRPLRYDALGLGNHDLENVNALPAFAAELGAPLVCFNLHTPGVVLWAHLPAYRGACATGFTTLDHGVVNETALGYAVPGGEAFWGELNTTLEAMRGAGCELIFVLGHGGLTLDIEVANRTPPSVVVMGGHDHDVAFSLRDPGKIAMHAGALLLQAGVLELNLTTDPKSGEKAVIGAHGEMVPLVDEASRLAGNGNDGPVLLELSWPRHEPPFDSRDCRFGRCPLGDAVAELMFLAAACDVNSTDVVVGALREAGSMRAALGRESTESELRDVLLWNNDLLVVELGGRDIVSMLVRSNQSIAQDGGGAALSLFGIRAGAEGNGIEVLTDEAVGDRCRANRAVVGPGPKDAPKRFRRLGRNETVLVTVTAWLWQGGDGFDVPDTPPVRTVGPEASAIVALLPKSVSPGTGILGAALGAIAKGLVAALVYGCSRAQTRDIVFRRGRGHRRLNFARIMPCPCRPGCLVTVVAVGTGHFLFWGILRTARLGCGMVLTSMFAALVVAIVENPLWVIVTRAQAADSNVQMQGSEDELLAHKVNNLQDEASSATRALSEIDGNSPGQTLPPNWLTLEYRNFVAIASTIWATKGPTGFYAGMVTNLLLALHPVLQANLYFICVRALASRVYQNAEDGMSEQDLLNSVPWLSVVSGVASTAIATLITYPLQVVRIRLQMEQPPFVGHY